MARQFLVRKPKRKTLFPPYQGHRDNRHVRHQRTPVAAPRSVSLAYRRFNLRLCTRTKLSAQLPDRYKALEPLHLDGGLANELKLWEVRQACLSALAETAAAFPSASSTWVTVLAYQRGCFDPSSQQPFRQRRQTLCSDCTQVSSHFYHKREGGNLASASIQWRSHNPRLPKGPSHRRRRWRRRRFPIPEHPSRASPPSKSLDSLLRHRLKSMPNPARRSLLWVGTACLLITTARPRLAHPTPWPPRRRLPSRHLRRLRPAVYPCPLPSRLLRPRHPSRRRHHCHRPMFTDRTTRRWRMVRPMEPPQCNTPRRRLKCFRRGCRGRCQRS